jgi:hypothetical protein
MTHPISRKERTAEMTFKPFDINLLPKRKGRSAQVNVEEANALMGILIENGTASDGKLYPNENDARVAAARAKRLAQAATTSLPGGKVLRTRVAQPIGSNKFAFVVSLGDEPPAKKEAPAKKGK